MRGVGDERALAGERVGEAVEHVVEGVGQHPHLLALALDVVDARVQVAGVHLRGDRGHPPQRAREAAPISSEASSAPASASRPARMNARATPRWARATLASGSPTPTVTSCRRRARGRRGCAPAA